MDWKKFQKCIYTMFSIKKDLSNWIKTEESRLGGYLVKSLYGKENMDEVKQRVYEWLLIHGQQEFENSDKFTSYIIKIAQGEIIKYILEQKGYVKPSMYKEHPAITKNFAQVKKDKSDEQLMNALDFKLFKAPENIITGVAKVELIEYCKTIMKPLYWKIVEERLFGTSLSQIGKKLGKNQKQIEYMVYKTIIPKLQNHV